MKYMKCLHDLFMLTVHADSDEEEEYNSKWTGEQIDDAVGSVRGNASSWSGKSTKAVYTTTVSASSWAVNSNGGFIVQTQNVSGILATDNPTIGIVHTGTYATDVAITDAWACVSRIVTKAGGLTLYAYNKRPSVNLPLQIQCMR